MMEYPHRRFNPLSGEWVLVSPHRSKRPWQGKIENTRTHKREKYDPTCYLCPGNKRVGGKKNDLYTSTYVFRNDFSALIDEDIENNSRNEFFFQKTDVKGECIVICFSPDHSLSLAEMDKDDIEKVIACWQNETEELAEKYEWVQIFENKGEIMGCSNPHPHGQIWASDFLPNEVIKEERNQKIYYEKNGRSLLSDYLENEQRSGKRIVLENELWTVITPYWAIWPFETILLPRKNYKRITDIRKNELSALSDIIKRLLVKYDNLFETSFPYTMGWHGAPFNNADDLHWTLHAHFYPPLLRSAEEKKFMVGYEMLAEAQRDITAESAAETLIKLEEIHYRRK